MLEDPVQHVGDGLEASVRMPRRALGLAGRVLHLAHLIHVDERVEVGEIDAGERAPDREAFSLEATRRGDHGTDRADRGGSLSAGKPLQLGDVVDGDRWHVFLSNAWSGRAYSWRGCSAAPVLSGAKD